MDYQFYIGVDISKKTFDYCIIDKEGILYSNGQVTNEKIAILEWLEMVDNELKDGVLWEQGLLCLEHSGYYAAPLLEVLHEETEVDIWLESALRIKRSMGLQRGKNDQMDAERIASYCLDFQRKARLWQPPSESIEELRLLVSHRDRLVKNLMSIQTTLKEEVGFVRRQTHDLVAEIISSPIETLKAAIAKLEQRIKELLEQDVKLTRMSEIIQSIPGFGQVIASKIIGITEGFTRLTDPKAFACYSGVAPFEHRSGTSLKGKTRISHFANKEMKKMLHLAAMVTIRKGNIMHQYYQRKVDQGKNKMSVINAIRNKLVHILFACIKNNTTYVKNFNHSLDRT